MTGHFSSICLDLLLQWVQLRIKSGESPNQLLGQPQLWEAHHCSVVCGWRSHQLPSVARQGQRGPFIPPLAALGHWTAGETGNVAATLEVGELPRTATRWASTRMAGCVWKWAYTILYHYTWWKNMRNHWILGYLIPSRFFSAYW